MKYDERPCPCESAQSGAGQGDKITTVTAPASELTQSFTVPPALPCSCVPYELICCCGPQNGISVIQPACQTLPDGRVVNNPAYDSQTGKSYWSYKFMTDCNSTTRAISNFGIPVCSLITEDILIVSEKIDGCGNFTQVPFTLTTDDPNFGPAPSGFQYVKVETSERFDKGVTVEYRLEIVGDYPIAIEPIKVKAATVVYTFDCGCFQVPQCNPQGKLSITKECGYTIFNNQATLNYHLTVNNIGDASLADVQFIDKITVPNTFSIGTITVSPQTLNVDTSTPGQIIISGNLGTITPGGEIIINYTIQITGIGTPGRYNITNTALVSAMGTQAVATCSSTLDAVQVATQKCCAVTDSNKGTYRFTITSVGLSPDVLVDVFDNLFIPGGITIQFTGFSGCTATFASTGNPVPLNTDITGPIRVNITCNSLLIPQSGSIHKDITFVLVSSSTVGTVTIENSVETVAPTNPDSQILLGAGILPAIANMNVELNLICTKVCTGI